MAARKNLKIRKSKRVYKALGRKSFTPRAPRGKKAARRAKKTYRFRENAPKTARMMKRPKGWVKASAVKIVGNKVYIRRAKSRKRRR